MTMIHLTTNHRLTQLATLVATDRTEQTMIHLNMNTRLTQLVLLATAAISIAAMCASGTGWG